MFGARAGTDRSLGKRSSAFMMNGVGVTASVGTGNRFCAAT